MQTIIPNLWFDNNAEEAVNFYTSIFENSKTKNKVYYDEVSSEVSNMPKDSIMLIEFELEGKEFIAINGGPAFKFTPATSFFINCKTEKEVKDFWEKLSPEGKILMPLDKYPFSEKYGWVQDKFGLSWQIMISTNSEKIIPCLMFSGKNQGKAEEAIKFYTDTFDTSEIISKNLYEEGESEADAKIAYSEFVLRGEKFVAMDSGITQPFTFNEAVSFLINCKNQDEIDFYWEKLSSDPNSEQCGWLKDQFGVSWQVSASIINELLKDPDKEKVKRVEKAMFSMKKIEIDKLEEAHNK